MIILQGRELTKSYGAELIFQDISFTITEGEKIGLVGPNGAGKTTLLRCLTGEEYLDDGEIMTGNGYRIGYLEQMPGYDPGTTLLDSVLDSFADIFAMRDRLRKLEQQMGQKQGEDLAKIMEQYTKLTHEYELAGGFACEAQARRVMKGIGFKDEDLTREVNLFSGGEKTRAGLARLLVREPDLLLLDEPTNHLDLYALEWLESYLKGYQGAVLLISHDRYFLDAIVNRVWELANKQLAVYPGNYSKYLVLKKEQELAQARAYEKQQKEIQRIEEYIRRYKAGIKAKQARGRAGRLERLEQIENVSSNRQIYLGRQSSGRSGDIVLKAEKLSMAYGSRDLFADLSFTIYQGEKVALIGKNGTGKSTILKIIVNKLQPSAGQAQTGSRVKIGYFDQEHKSLHNDYRVIDELIYDTGLKENEARDRLAQVLFQGDDVYKKVADLSGGEKGRLSLLKLILSEPNFLVLDEPTNHLDISAKEIVEEFLEDFSGTILVVSHDRFLLDQITTRTMELENGKLHNYLGNYAYFRERKETLIKPPEPELKKREKKAALNTGTNPQINKSKLRAEIARLEEQIIVLEEERKALGAELAAPETYQNEEVSREKISRFKKLEEEIPLLYEKWAELNQTLEES
ncbi:MAG: ABC-F family ATP-binding cassette domain-containing protein [Peptococcaceae bacterium]